jgi:hypothetical protein
VRPFEIIEAAFPTSQFEPTPSNLQNSRAMPFMTGSSIGILRQARRVGRFFACETGPLFAAGFLLPQKSCAEAPAQQASLIS